MLIWLLESDSLTNSYNDSPGPYLEVWVYAGGYTGQVHVEHVESFSGDGQVGGVSAVHVF